jgi:carboxypeptidase Taq
VEAQEDFCRSLAADLGYDYEAGRLDRSAHPFTNGTFRDVRITTRYSETFLNMALFGTIHETGHALYEQGLDPERFRMPAGQACSLGIHESQSRFWENVVGRSRPFWSRYFPKLRRAFPAALEGVEEGDFYRAINAVKPSLIRVEADEVTYNLHIILRFELERALLRGSLEPKDLPEAWRTGMKSLLGMEPPSDREGVLQDIHWAAGLVGYFPTYALGNLYGGQFLQALRADLPDLDARIAAGDFAPVREWLRIKIHRQGRRHLAPELCLRVTGSALSATPLMAYLEEKFTDVYGL